MCNETGHIIKAAWLDVMDYYNRLTRYLTRLGKSEVLLVPKPPLGNGVFEAPASRRMAKQEPAR